MSKKHNISFSLVLLAWLIFGSCTKEIVIQPKEVQPSVVVDGWIENDAYAEIFLTESFPILNHFDSARILETFLNYAKIELFDDTGDSEILTLYRKNTFFPPFVYKTTRIKGKIGHSYRIEITHRGEIIYAKTTIPNLPTATFTGEYATGDKMKIQAQVKDLSEEQEFFYYKTKRAGIDAIYAPSLNSTFTDRQSENGSFIKLLQKPVQINFDSFYQELESKESTPEEFDASDTVFIKFSSLDRESYETLHLTFYNLRNSANPFKASGLKIADNIEGGIGHFTGLATIKDTVCLAKSNLNP